MYLTPHLPLVELIYVRGLHLRVILHNYYIFPSLPFQYHSVYLIIFHLNYNLESCGCVVLPLKFTFRSSLRDQKVMHFRVGPLTLICKSKTRPADE